MNKEASIKGFGRVMSRTLGGSMLGASMGMSKGIEANKNNPNSSDNIQEANMLGGALAGATAGALISGPGIGLVKGGIGKAIKGIKRIGKIAEMEVPTEDEKKKVCNQESSEEKKASQHIDDIAKLAGYLKTIKCEECSYEGKPLGDGRCPKCGSIGGIKPKQVVHPKPNDYSREIKTKEYFDYIGNSHADINPYI